MSLVNTLKCVLGIIKFPHIYKLVAQLSYQFLDHTMHFAASSLSYPCTWLCHAACRFQILCLLLLLLLAALLPLPHLKCLFVLLLLPGEQEYFCALWLAYMHMVLVGIDLLRMYNNRQIFSDNKKCEAGFFNILAVKGHGCSQDK